MKNNEPCHTPKNNNNNNINFFFKSSIYFFVLFLYFCVFLDTKHNFYMFLAIVQLYVWVNKDQLKIRLPALHHHHHHHHHKHHHHFHCCFPPTPTKTTKPPQTSRIHILLSQRNTHTNLYTNTNTNTYHKTYVHIPIYTSHCWNQLNNKCKQTPTNSNLTMLKSVEMGFG